MKRSEVNEAIEYALKMLEENQLFLPSFGYWTAGEWATRKDHLDNMRKVMLGWDVTDFGQNNYMQTGAVLFTIRNGSLDGKAGTPYAEKLIFLRHSTEQQLPHHFHTQKTEDIINRGGGILCLQLYNSLPDGRLDQENHVRVLMDGLWKIIPPGQTVEISRGSSITIHPGLYHRFWAKKGCGDLILGEVSSINNDLTDNTFLDAGVRFSVIEEDEPAKYLLCNEY